jgi:hypothetical protein
LSVASFDICTPNHPLFQVINMSVDSEKGNAGKGPQDLAPITITNSLEPGETVVIDDAAVREFYGGAVNDSYRLKSELVSQHLAEIGMGK